MIITGIIFGHASTSSQAERLHSFVLHTAQIMHKSTQRSTLLISCYYYLHEIKHCGANR